MEFHTTIKKQIIIVRKMFSDAYSIQQNLAENSRKRSKTKEQHRSSTVFYRFLPMVIVYVGLR